MTTDERTAFELEYWKLVLADVRALSDLIERGAAATIEVPVALAESMLAPESERGGRLLAASSASREAMNVLHEMVAPIERLAQLVDGRVKALRGA